MVILFLSYRTFILYSEGQMLVKTNYWKSKPDALWTGLNRISVYPIIGFLVRSYCMNCTLYLETIQASFLYA